LGPIWFPSLLSSTSLAARLAVEKLETSEESPLIRGGLFSLVARPVAHIEVASTYAQSPIGP
jgi:hypothetical protein